MTFTLVSCVCPEPGIQVVGPWGSTGSPTGGELTLTVQIWKQMGWVPMRMQQVMTSRMKGSTFRDVSREGGCQGQRMFSVTSFPVAMDGATFFNREAPKPLHILCDALTLLALQHSPSLSCCPISTPSHNTPVQSLISAGTWINFNCTETQWASL